MRLPGRSSDANAKSARIPRSSVPFGLQVTDARVAERGADSSDLWCMTSELRNLSGCRDMGRVGTGSTVCPAAERHLQGDGQGHGEHMGRAVCRAVGRPVCRATARATGRAVVSSEPRRRMMGERLTQCTCGAGCEAQWTPGLGWGPQYQPPVVWCGVACRRRCYQKAMAGSLAYGNPKRAGVCACAHSVGHLCGSWVRPFVRRSPL